MLYDQHRGAPAMIPCEGLSADDVLAFCKSANIEFFAVGTPDNWNDKDVFRAGTIEYPAKGCTVPFQKVLEWKAAIQAIGERVIQNGRYISHTGEVCTTMGEAIDDASKQPVLIYQAVNGQLHTCAMTEFFNVINDHGKLVPRFKYAPA